MRREFFHHLFFVLLNTYIRFVLCSYILWIYYFVACTRYAGVFFDLFYGKLWITKGCFHSPVTGCVVYTSTINMNNQGWHGVMSRSMMMWVENNTFDCEDNMQKKGHSAILHSSPLPAPNRRRTEMIAAFMAFQDWHDKTKSARHLNIIYPFGDFEWQGVSTTYWLNEEAYSMLYHR